MDPLGNANPRSPRPSDDPQAEIEDPSSSQREASIVATPHGSATKVHEHLSDQKTFNSSPDGPSQDHRQSGLQRRDEQPSGTNRSQEASTLATDGQEIDRQTPVSATQDDTVSIDKATELQSAASESRMTEAPEDFTNGKDGPHYNPAHMRSALPFNSGSPSPSTKSEEQALPDFAGNGSSGTVRGARSKVRRSPKSPREKPYPNQTESPTTSEDKAIEKESSGPKTLSETSHTSAGRPLSSKSTESEELQRLRKASSQNGETMSELRREIEELQIEVKAVRGELESTEQRGKDLATDLSKERNTGQEVLRGRNIHVTELEGTIAGKEEAIADLLRELSDCKSDLQSFKASLMSSQSENQRLKEHGECQAKAIADLESSYNTARESSIQRRKELKSSEDDLKARKRMEKSVVINLKHDLAVKENPSNAPNEEDFLEYLTFLIEVSLKRNEDSQRTIKRLKEQLSDKASELASLQSTHGEEKAQLESKHAAREKELHSTIATEREIAKAGIARVENRIKKRQIEEKKIEGVEGNIPKARISESDANAMREACHQVERWYKELIQKNGEATKLSYLDMLNQIERHLQKSDTTVRTYSLEGESGTISDLRKQVDKLQKEKMVFACQSMQLAETNAFHGYLQDQFTALGKTLDLVDQQSSLLEDTRTDNKEKAIAAGAVRPSAQQRLVDGFNRKYSNITREHLVELAHSHPKLRDLPIVNTDEDSEFEEGQAGHPLTVLKEARQMSEGQARAQTMHDKSTSQTPYCNEKCPTCHRDWSSHGDPLAEDSLARSEISSAANMSSRDTAQSKSNAIDPTSRTLHDLLIDGANLRPVFNPRKRNARSELTSSNSPVVASRRSRAAMKGSRDAHSSKASDVIKETQPFPDRVVTEGPYQVGRLSYWNRFWLWLNSSLAIVHQSFSLFQEQGPSITQTVGFLFLFSVLAVAVKMSAENPSITDKVGWVENGWAGPPDWVYDPHEQPSMDIPLVPLVPWLRTLKARLAWEFTDHPLVPRWYG